MRSTTIALPALALLVSACSASASAGNSGTGTAANGQSATQPDGANADAAAPTHAVAGNTSTAPIATQGASNAKSAPQPTPTASARSAGDRTSDDRKAFSGAHGLVRLTYPSSLSPSHSFGVGTLVTNGWRFVWDGTPVGPGHGIVSFSQAARPENGNGSVTDYLQIGLSRDPGVVAHCTTAGLVGPDGGKTSHRMLGGHEWTVRSNGDAGMSQEVDATDFRTVVDGVCYAIDRAKYIVKAGSHPPAGAPSQKVAAARIASILKSIRVGGTT